MNSFMKLLNRLRRYFNILRERNYVKKQIAKRKGKCKKCGKCCEGCEHLDKKTKLCKTYKNRPWYCYKEFPLDKTDQKVFGVKKTCGYKF